MATCKRVTTGRVKGLPFLAILIRVISAMRVLFKQFFTIFVVSTKMPKLPVSAPALRLRAPPTKSKLFQLPRGSQNHGCPEIRLLERCEGAFLEYQANFGAGLRVS